jgi:putative ABC transport system permease protein
MAVILLLVSFIIEEKSVNTGFENINNICRIRRSDGKSIVPVTLRDDVKSKIPGVEKLCYYCISERLYKHEDKKEKGRFIATNDDFLEMFSFHFIYRSVNPTLSIKNQVILTRKFSEKLYGTLNPVGKILDVNNQQFVIAGVVTDLPENSSFKFDAFINFELAPILNMGYINENHVLMNACLMLDPRANYGDVNSQISGMISHWLAFKDVKLSLDPFRKVYFISLPDDQMEHANVHMLYLLSGISGIILFMTIFNYVNVTISTGHERMTEIGIKKATGAGKRNIFRQMLTESLLVSFLSMILAVFVLFLITPVFSDILGKELVIKSLFSQHEILLTGVLIFLTTGILSGIYPALAFSGISPVQIINGRKENKGKKWTGVIVVQFLITCVLIISLLFIIRQLEYVRTKDLGFDKEMMVRLELRGISSKKWHVLKDELIKNPGIVSISASGGSPMEIPGWSSNQFDIDGEKKTIEIKSFGIDENFVETFGLTLLKGRNFELSDSNVCLINEHLYHELGWNEIEGQKLMGKRVIGVVKNFHYEDLYTGIGNLQLQPVQDYANVLNMKLRGDLSKNLGFIKGTYFRIEPEVPLSFRFYDDWIQSMYQKEEKQAYAINVFTLLAVIISCLGLIGLVEHTTNKRIKEIGIRKINGAKVSEILSLLNREIIKSVVIAFVLACPVAYYAVHKWLENFAYKTGLSWWIFVLAGLLALGIALLTVSWQSWKAATRNPVEALRYE